MCWTVEISFTFGFFELFLLVVIGFYYDQYFKCIRGIIPILITVCVVQLSEGVIWLTNPTEQVPDNCPTGNFIGKRSSQ